MKKKMILLFLLLLLPSIVKAGDINSSIGATTFGCDDGVDSCWEVYGKLNGSDQLGLRSVRVTIFNEKAERVSNSVDILLNTLTDQELNEDKINVSSTFSSKIEYINGKTLDWTIDTDFNTLKNKNNFILLGNDNNNVVSAILKYKTEKNSYQDAIATYFEAKGFRSVDGLKAKLQFCGDAYSSNCTKTSSYYAVFEPTTVVAVKLRKKTIRLYGTAYELAATVWGYSHIGSTIHRDLPNALYITGKQEYLTFYENAKIQKFNNSYYIYLQKGYYTKENGQDKVKNGGVGIGVFKWEGKNLQDKVQPSRTDITCNVNVTINECGNSSIYEASYGQKECVVDNEAYSYIKECNLYCYDEVTTDFSGFYNNFVGNNTLGAIVSGKYMAITNNPKITIKKTCYQSGTANDCNVTTALTTKLKEEYRTNKMYLTVDDRTYNLIGTPSINQNGLSATITYEYKLDNSINKYIDIETMKGTQGGNNKTYNNEESMIITSKGYYGTYNYKLNISETVLNKYVQNSSSYKKLKNTQSSKYNFTNTIDIVYNSVNGDKKNYYVSDNLISTCSYIKYNSDTGCICAENKCCDSVTCKEVTCPPDTDGKTCSCTGKYGCYDDGKCTPIEEPTKDSGDSCNPEEKTCFPNLIYRPISLTDPFPGINGNGRTPGNNWNKIYTRSDGKGISYSEYYITSRRGYEGYEIYQAEPLYVIKLDSDKIKSIRKYNETHDYNNFDLTCIDGENCISKFLRGQTKDFNTNLIESGTCKNINNYNFDSCIKNKG